MQENKYDALLELSISDSIFRIVSCIDFEVRKNFESIESIQSINGIKRKKRGVCDIGLFRIQLCTSFTGIKEVALNIFIP